MNWPATRPDLPSIAETGTEPDLLNAFLDYYRAALVDRAYGLSIEQMRLTPLPSSLSLASLIGHMAWVERFWFQHRFAGEAMPEPFASLDFDTDRDAEMTLAGSLDLDELLRLFHAAVADSRQRVADASSLEALSAMASSRSGESWNLRWIMLHMIEEYARHCGHADLIREAIDGDIAR